MDISEFSDEKRAELLQIAKQTYFINGFRSLQNFAIELNSGLNVIVGKNGSGKTNFIDFLDFLSIFIDDGMHAAISSAGGISRVFSQEMIRSRNPRIQAKATGIADLGEQPFGIESKSQRSLFKFEYCFEIRYIRLSSLIYISKESIAFKSLVKRDFLYGYDSNVGKISVERKYDPKTEQITPKWEIGKRLFTNSLRNPLRQIRRLRPTTKSTEKLQREEIFANYFEDILTEPDQSILSTAYKIPALSAVNMALTRGRSFNFLPSKARAPSDISAAPEIERDGSGLTSVLYHMQQAKIRDHQPRHPYYNTTFDSRSLNKVTDWTAYLLPELESLQTTADLHVGKYISTMQLYGDRTGVRIPLQSASDGTLKWLSLACHLVSNRYYFSIEEPENFLHPRMQSFLIELLREKLEETANEFVILSTHSETLLNQCNPKELLLFHFDGQKTISKKLVDPENVSKEINSTGFGLGHYYATNAIS